MDQTKVRIRVLLGFMIISWGHAVAQCCSGGVPLSGNLGMPDAEEGILQVAVSYDYNKLSRFQTGREVLTSREFSRESSSVLFQLGYAFSDKWSVDLFSSWIRQSNRALLAETEFTTKGIGDLTLLLKYKVLSSLNVGYGIKAPLGASDFTSTRNGIVEQLSLDMQPGSGAWDHIFWMGYTTTLEGLRPSMTFATISSFRLTGENDDFFTSSYEVGNEFSLRTSLSDRVLFGTLIFDPSLSINYLRRGTDTIFQSDNPNSGGDFIFINPGIAYQVSPTLSLQLNGAIPVYRDVGGTQVAPTYRINTGLLYRLKIKKNEEFEI